MTAKGRASGDRFKAAVTLAVLMGAFVAANAMAASANLVECSEMKRNSQDLVVAMDQLSVKSVEHIVPTLDDEIIRSLDLMDLDLQTDAPILSLSPRVATMLDRIFEIDQTPLQADESDFLRPCPGIRSERPASTRASRWTRQFHY